MSVANNPDLIEENRGHFRTQSITVSLIPLENPERFFDLFLFLSVINSILKVFSYNEKYSILILE